MRVVTLRPLAKQEVTAIVKRAATALSASDRIAPSALDYIAELSGGDARKALGTLELALSLAETVDETIVESAAGKRLPGYDKSGDMHYDIVSAFIKSMRGSDTDASLYYLARMLDAGEDPAYIARQMVLFASEDIGLAGNGALPLALAALQSIERIGMPESSYILFHVASALAKSAKSRESTDAMHAAQQLAKQYPSATIPLHLRNSPTKLMKDLGYGEGYKWEADFKHEKGFMPEEMSAATSHDSYPSQQAT
jgi:putative ATPase